MKWMKIAFFIRKLWSMREIEIYIKINHKKITKNTCSIKKKMIKKESKNIQQKTVFKTNSEKSGRKDFWPWKLRNHATHRQTYWHLVHEEFTFENGKGRKNRSNEWSRQGNLSKISRLCMTNTIGVWIQSHRIETFLCGFLLIFFRSHFGRRQNHITTKSVHCSILWRFHIKRTFFIYGRQKTSSKIISVDKKCDQMKIQIVICNEWMVLTEYWTYRSLKSG